MNIQILQLVEGARQAKGLTVIIDVFRAFSLTCYLFDQGVDAIFPVGNIDFAYRLKEENPEYILIGERNNKKMPGFDFGNSPFEIRNFDFTGKTIIHTTSAGTQGLVSASGADELITGSFVNAEAIIRYLRAANPAIVSLVCMGYSSKYPVEEDTYCAEYIKSQLENTPTDYEQMVETIRQTSGRRFFNPDTQHHCPEQDFYLCLELSKFNIVLKAEPGSDNRLVLRKFIPA